MPDDHLPESIQGFDCELLRVHAALPVASAMTAIASR